MRERDRGLGIMDEEEEEEEMKDGGEADEEEEEEDEFIKDWVVNQFVSQPQLPPKAVTKQHQKSSSSSSDHRSPSRTLNQRRKPISSTINSSDPSENIKNWNVDIIKFSKNVEHTNRAATSRFWDIMEVIFFNLSEIPFLI